MIFNMKKIVYVLKSLAVKAGTERVMSDKMNYLADHGYSVTLITYEQGDHSLAFPLHPSIRISTLIHASFLLIAVAIIKGCS